MRKALGRSVVFLWVLSYLVIFCVPMVACVFIYHTSAQMMRSQLLAVGTLSLQTVREQMDAEIQQVMSDSFEIWYPNDFGWILEQEDFSSVDAMQLRRTVSLLSEAQALKPAIDAVYLYFHGADTLISNISTQSAARYYDYYYGDYTNDKQAWLALVTGDYHEQSEIRSITLQNGTRQSRFTYFVNTVRPVNAGQGYNIIIQLSSAKLNSIFAPAEYGEANRQLYVLNGQGDIIYENNEVAHDAAVIRRISQETKGHTETRIDKDSYVAIQLDSATAPYRYLMLVSQEAFYGQLATMRVIILAVALLAMVMGVVLTVVMVRVNYNPLRRLLAALQSQGGTAPRANEYRLIESALTKLNTQNSEMNQQVYRQERQLKNAFLGRLLHGAERSETRIRGQLAQYGIELAYPYFAVVSVSVDEYSPEVFLDAAERAEDESIRDQLATERLLFVIGNVAQELLGEGCVCHTAIADTLVSCICNLRTSRAADFRKLVNGATGQLSRLLRDNFACEITVAASDIMAGVASLADAYSQIAYTLEYSQSFAVDEAVFYAQIQPAGQGLYSIPESAKRQLRNSLEAGDADHISEVVEGILGKSLAGTHLADLDTARFLAADIINTLLSAEAFAQNGDAEKSQQFMKKAREVLACKSHEQLGQVLRESIELYLALLDAGGRTGGKQAEPLCEAIAAYVHGHYSDFDLSNTSIGEALGINPSYASRVIRKEYGVGLLDFINGYRIEQAKALLAGDADITVEELARRVGFATAKTFTRCFKKFTGVTPGKYREENT